jgi:hypothetical protein
VVRDVVWQTNDPARSIGYDQDVNWTWTIRSADGGMNGLEFARATTAGGFSRVLIHAAPTRAQIEVWDEEDRLVARGDVDRQDDYSPMTLLEINGGGLRRQEIWPDQGLYGVPVLVAGGEVGLLRSWEHAEDRSWWRWTVEFSNHTGRPSDWSPPEPIPQR